MVSVTPTSLLAVAAKDEATTAVVAVVGFGEVTARSTFEVDSGVIAGAAAGIATTVLLLLLLTLRVLVRAAVGCHCCGLGG